MDEIDYFDKYESEANSLAEIDGMQDIKINPQYYLHDCILKLNTALIMPDKTNFNDQYIFLVGHLESLCYASNYIPDDYDNKVKAKHEELASDNRPTETRRVLLAQEKLKLLLTKVFGSKAGNFRGKL